MNDVIELLQAHRSIRTFTAQPVPDELIEQIVRCGQAAATSSNIQATTVIRVRDAGKRERIAGLAGGQSYVASAGAFLVFCADLHRAKLACERQGGDFDGGMTEPFIVATVDAALTAQNCAVAAESLGLGICYIGGIRNNPQAVADLLELPDSVYPVFGMCLGHPDQDPEVKPRLPLSAVLMEDRYQEAVALDGIERYDEQLRDYYRNRSGGQKNSSWSEEMTVLASKSRPHMREFLARRGFIMK
jgi:nitroreductase